MSNSHYTTSPEDLRTLAQLIGPAGSYSKLSNSPVPEELSRLTRVHIRLSHPKNGAVTRGLYERKLQENFPEKIEDFSRKHWTGSWKIVTGSGEHEVRAEDWWEKPLTLVGSLKRKMLRR
eukprot:GHVR01080577.1.p1 GENE.GHVR01080577.1~~GHVR01080577.1.p1  ORF type:complete len:120 (+),score=0.92 GHVR01080577.1:773-1132(+)